jgi:hypothetical protein
MIILFESVRHDEVNRYGLLKILRNCKNPKNFEKVTKKMFFQKPRKLLLKTTAGSSLEQ